MSRATLARLASTFPAMALFAWGALTAIDVPGISMDSVNPDYLAVALLHPSTKLPDWTVPGGLIFDRIPLLGQIYHGALSLYLGLPAYTLFGTGLLGIRVANLVFGLLVLAAAAAFLTAFRVRPLLAGAGLAALALDPAFLFAFRTPFYITLLTAAPTLASLALIEHQHTRPGNRSTFVAGLFAGLAIYGYFIAAFALPVLAVHAWLRCPTSRRELVPVWLAGLALGLAPYPIAALLLLSHHALLSTLSGDMQILIPARSSLNLAARLQHFATMLRWTIEDVGPAALMLQTPLPPALPTLKAFLLLILPSGGLLLGLLRPGRHPGLAITAGLVAATALLFLVFGDRLWLQHVIPLLPVLYATLAITLETCTPLLPSALMLVPLLPLLATNTTDRHAMFAALRQTGGVGLYSDALTRFAEDSRRNHAPTHAYFPDWGVFTSFAMLTSGRIPITLAFTQAEALQSLCAGEDALLAIVANQSRDSLQPSTTELAWSPPTRITYRQRDGTPVLETLRWHAVPPPADACPASPLQ